MEIIDLRKNQITDIGAKALSKSKCLPKLQTIDLSGNELTQEGIDALAEFKVFNLIRARLGEEGTKLDLSNLGVGDVECKCIAECEELEELTHLYLELNKITNKGAELLAGSEYLKNLTLLSLDRNKICDEGFIHIFKSEHFVKIRV